MAQKAHSASLQSPEERKWGKIKVVLKDMLGKKFKLRLRFTTRSRTDNNFPGWFVDDLKVFAGK